MINNRSPTGRNYVYSHWYTKDTPGEMLHIHIHTLESVGDES